MRTSSYRAFGLGLDADFPLPGRRPTDDQPRTRLALRLSEGAELERHWRRHGSVQLWHSVIDGCPVLLERSGEGDHRITYGDRAVFWLSPGPSVVLCAPADPIEPAWKRFLLDTVLGVASVLRGYEALHAGAVECASGVVALLAETGGGKTSLTAELVRRGHPLFSDDILALERVESEIVAHPGPPLMNLPLQTPGESSAASLGRTLATFGDEAWVEVARASGGPRRLAALFIVDRRQGLEPGVARLDPNVLDLLPHSKGAATLGGRSRRRFEVFAEIAAGTPVYRLEADLGAGPRVLGDLVERAVRDTPRELVEAAP